MLVMLFLDERVVVDYGFKVYISLVWVSKHVWLIYMTCLIMHETFKMVKYHVSTECPFLVCFALICAYGLILEQVVN